MHKVYVAGNYNNKVILQVLAEWLVTNYKVEIVSSWLYEHEFVSLKHHAERDLMDIEECDIVVMTTGRLGTSSELGFAIGKGKKIVFFTDEMTKPNIYTSNMQKGFENVFMGVFEYYGTNDVDVDSPYIIAQGLEQLRGTLENHFKVEPN